MRNVPLFVLMVFMLFSCGSEKSKNVENKLSETQVTTADSTNSGEEWREIMGSVVRIDSYDNDRILESGQGFFVGENLIVTRYTLIKQANNVDIFPLDTEKKYNTIKYVAVDRINDLVILYTDSLKRNPIELFQGEAPGSAKSMYISPNSGKTIQLSTGKVLNLATVQGVKVYRLSNAIRNANYGMPVFVSNKKAIGVAYAAVESYQLQSFAIPSFYVSELLSKRKAAPETLNSLRSISSEAVAAENRSIKGLVLETEMGNITIRLFNETPEYRDNFIKLAKENYFDNLLIHRVIKDFGIQSGAADTRYAAKGAIVGFKGPGYTMPANIIPGLYHKRGMIGSPRKPDTENERRRSDGSQFYIVSGRKYFDQELNELEKENNYKFSPEQREAYKTVGGAPHLDGSYTVFGEVISGMDVVDKIVQVETDLEWRPIDDIRLKKINILK